MLSERIEYMYEGAGERDECSRTFARFSINNLIGRFIPEGCRSFCLENDFSFYGSGWQSWGFGGEVACGKAQEKYFPVIPQWKQYFTPPGRRRGISRRALVGCFIMYLRWNVGGRNVYLALCSTGNCRTGTSALPPVVFGVDRNAREIVCSVISDGHEWRRGDKIAELFVFGADGFFELKDSVRALYSHDEGERFGRLSFLGGGMIGGWESWYNHYADINWNLIRADLDSLDTSQNIVKVQFIDGGKPCVFQVDDGWERALGDWDADKSRFPSGMRALASEISSRGYVPGLWLAPFIVDFRSEFARNHRDWILRDKKGKPVAAGMNPLWGASFGKEQPSLPHSYFCLDLSRGDVLDYLDSLMEKVIEEWGFRYIKLDFLFAGMLVGNFAREGAPYEWYDKAVRVLTRRTVNAAGEGVAYLGCGLPFESSFNAFPLSRIGPDTKEAWDVGWLRAAHFPARTSAFANMQSTLGHAFWDGAVFLNDPDVVFMRSENIMLCDKEKILIALVNFLFASQLMYSDDPTEFDVSREGKLTEKICGLFGKFGGIEFGVENISPVAYSVFSRNGKYRGIINLGDSPFRAERKTVAGAATDDAALEPVIEFASGRGNALVFEPHSISLYEVRYGGAEKNEADSGKTRF